MLWMEKQWGPLMFFVTKGENIAYVCVKMQKWLLWLLVVILPPPHHRLDRTRAVRVSTRRWSWDRSQAHLLKVSYADESGFSIHVLKQIYISIKTLSTGYFCFVFLKKLVLSMTLLSTPPPHWLQCSTVHHCSILYSNALKQCWPQFKDIKESHQTSEYTEKGKHCIASKLKEISQWEFPQRLKKTKRRLCFSACCCASILYSVDKKFFAGCCKHCMWSNRVGHIFMCFWLGCKDMTSVSTDSGKRSHIVKHVNGNSTVKLFESPFLFHALWMVIQHFCSQLLSFLMCY